MKCRFNHMVKVTVWKDGKQVEVERPATGKHWFEKICPACREAGRTMADYKALRKENNA